MAIVYILFLCGPYLCVRSIRTHQTRVGIGACVDGFAVVGVEPNSLALSDGERTLIIPRWRVTPWGIYYGKNILVALILGGREALSF